MLAEGEWLEQFCCISRFLNCRHLRKGWKANLSDSRIQVVKSLLATCELSWLWVRISFKLQNGPRCWNSVGYDLNSWGCGKRRKMSGKFLSYTCRKIGRHFSRLASTHFKPRFSCTSDIPAALGPIERCQRERKLPVWYHWVKSWDHRRGRQWQIFLEAIPGGRIMAPKEVPVLMPRMHGYVVTLHGRRDCRCD